MALLPTEALVLLAGVFGLLVGSFLNVVIHRLPKMMELQWQREAAELRGETAPEGARFNLVVPRSACPHCGHRITALENIPVLSWLFLRGRCSSCAKPIPFRYPLIEVLAALACGLAIWQFGLTTAGVAACGLSLTLLTLTWIDLDTTLLPDSLTLPLIWAGLLLNLQNTFVALPAAVVGAAAGYLALWSVYWLFKLVTGKEGMGYGDFKLLAALGAWFGWQSLPAIILLSSLVGAVVGVALILTRRHAAGNPIPFGPYLAGAGLLALYFREPLRAVYGI
jgi:leader peptidase (prepilin peptidase) / N-methyltransferase